MQEKILKNRKKEERTNKRMIHWTRLMIMPVTFWDGGGGGGEVVQGYTIHVHAIHTCYKSPTTHIHLSLSISFVFTFPWISAGQIHGFQLTITNTINIAEAMNALATRLISVGLMDTPVATAVYYSDTEASLSLRHFRHRISVLWVWRYWTDSDCDCEWS